MPNGTCFRRKAASNGNPKRQRGIRLFGFLADASGFQGKRCHADQTARPVNQVPFVDRYFFFPARRGVISLARMFLSKMSVVGSWPWKMMVPFSSRSPLLGLASGFRLSVQSVT